MSVKIQSVNNGSSWDVDEEFEESDLSFDEQTHPAATPLCKGISRGGVHGLIDIILHPTYQVPCPYIRLFDNTGQPITERIYQALIRKKIVQGNGQCSKVERDKIEPLISDDAYEDFDDVENIDDQPSVNYEVIYEEHPYLQIPCLCVHICGLLPRIELLESSGQPMKSISSAQGCQTEDNLSTDSLPCTTTTTTGSNSIDSYFLHWLVLMGPTIGLEITTDLYKDILVMNSL